MQDGKLIIFQDGTPVLNWSVWLLWSIDVPVHMSSINRTCAAHRAAYITKWGSNRVPPTSLQRLLHRQCWASHSLPNKCSCLVKLLISPWTRAIRSSSWRYRSTIHHTLHTTPHKIAERRQIWWSCWPNNWSPSTNPSIWICEVEVISHISIKVRRWINGCIPTVLEHQNKSEQIVTPLSSQTSTL